MTRGGGALVWGSAILSGSVFQDNSCTADFCLGGGLSVFNTLAVTGTQFLSNTAAACGSGGGLKIEHQPATLNGALFQNNHSGSDGGGAYVLGSVILSGGLFLHNNAGSGGGGLWTADALALTGTQFIDNAAAIDGGGVYHGGAGSGRIVNALFACNLALSTGSALYLGSTASVEVLHTTIANITLCPACGAALHVTVGTVGISNTIVASYTTGVQQVGGTVYADYNLYFGNTVDKAGVIGGGTYDVSGEPVFVDPINANYHLGPESPALDSGVDASVNTDFDGDLRPQGRGLDIGYDEVSQQCSLSTSANYVFGNPAITLTFSDLGSINCLAGVYFPRAADNAIGTVENGVGADHVWQIAAHDSSGLPATGFVATITLPYDGSAIPDPVICFYPGGLGGAGWDCIGTQTYDGSTVTRPGITHFSNWAVGSQVGPTAVTLQAFTARTAESDVLAGGPSSLIGILSLLAGSWWLWRRKRRAD
jgi:hypothetical protein